MKHQITIDIDDDALASYSDERLAVCWHVAQANPASSNDQLAGELAERVGREIICRWLCATPPALWSHQGRHHYQQQLSRFATRTPGGPPDEPAAFGSGHWVPREDRSVAPGGGEPS
jgi:hypothetical protein